MKITGFYTSKKINHIKVEQKKLQRFIQGSTLSLLAFAPLELIARDEYYNTTTNKIEHIYNSIPNNAFNIPAYIWDEKAQRYVQVIKGISTQLSIDSCSLIEKPFFYLGRKIQEGFPILSYFTDTEINPVKLGGCVSLLTLLVLLGFVVSSDTIRNKLKQYKVQQIKIKPNDNEFDYAVEIGDDNTIKDSDKLIAKLVIVSGVCAMIFVLSI